MYYYSLETVLDNEHGTTLSIGNDTEEKLFTQFFSTLKAGGVPDGTPFKSLTLTVRIPNNAGNWGKPRDRQLSTRQRQKRNDRMDRTMNNHRAWRNPIDLDEEEEEDEEERRDEEEEEERRSTRRQPAPKRRTAAPRRSRVRYRDEEEEEEEEHEEEEEERGDDAPPPFENYDDAYQEYARRYGYRSGDNKTDRMKSAPKKRIRSVRGAQQRDDHNVRAPPPSQPRRTLDDDIMKDDDNDHEDAVLRGKAPPPPPPAQSRPVSSSSSGPPPRTEEQHRAMENEVVGIKKLVSRFRDKQALPAATIACGQVLLENIEQHLARYYSHGEYRGTSYNALQSIVKDTKYEMDKLQAPPPPPPQQTSSSSTNTGLPEIGGID